MRCAVAMILLLLWAFTGGFVQGSDVPVAWQLVHEGWPNDELRVYYDTVAKRVRGLEQSSPGNPPRAWELAEDDLWRRVFPGGAPPLNYTACIGYDSARHLLLHVDEFGSTHALEDGIWSPVSTGVSPPPPKHCEMAFDASRAVMVYIGVESWDNDAPNATWEYDGTAWIEADPVDPPPDGSFPELTYDSDRGVVLAFGEPFDDSKPVFQAFVWEYSGVTWAPITPLGVGSPGRRRQHAWVYDSDRGEALIYAGIQDTIGTQADLWAWDGTRWTRIDDDAAPGARTRCEAVHDTLGARIVFYGGRGVSSEERLTTWALVEASWTAISSWNGPLGFSYYGMTAVPDREKILIVGGRSADNLGSEETWLWDEEGWRRDDLAIPPSASTAFDIAFDENEGLVLGFGGMPYPNQTQVRDTHRYEGEGIGWESTVLSGPRARRNAGIAYSALLYRTVLFGGLINDSQGVEKDNSIWEYIGTGWSELFPPLPHPSPRENCPLAADSLRGVLWMYSGNDNGHNPDEPSDLWHFDGAVWTMVGEESPPGQRSGHGLAHDPTRDRLVVFGDGPSTEEVTWEWGDGVWLGRETATKPETDRTAVKLTYDPTREVIFLFGGSAPGARYDLWAYGADPDEDGIVGQLDNCRDTANPGQENLDGDLNGDACDCANGDAGAWALPPEVEGVAFDPSGESLSWEDLDQAAGPDTVYDALRGSVTDLPLTPSSSATCLERSLPTPSLTDVEAPPSGVAWWYLVRGRNTCGAGSYGMASDATERVNGVCD